MTVNLDEAVKVYWEGITKAYIQQTGDESIVQTWAEFVAGCPNEVEVMYASMRHMFDVLGIKYVEAVKYDA